MEETAPFYADTGYDTASFLPFHETTADYGTSDKQAKLSQLNYMFGQRIDLTFTVPEGGQVNMAAPGKDEKMEDVTFEFQGDDDCWIFIDGQLVLDMGGIHDAVRGTINFQTREWHLYRDLDNKDHKDIGVPDTGSLLTGLYVYLFPGSGTFIFNNQDSTATHTLTMFIWSAVSMPPTSNSPSTSPSRTPCG